MFCVPPVLSHKFQSGYRGSGKGWISAEYGMIPRSTHSRMNREKAATSGRTQEISRLIGRSLRAAVDLQKLGEKQIYVDCDVLQADGEPELLRSPADMWLWLWR